MKFLEMIKSWFNKKEIKTEKDSNIVIDEKKLQTSNNIDLEVEIKKLNSRISFVTEKMEQLAKQQEQLLCQMEQILFHASGSFTTEEYNIDNTEIKLENGKNLVNIRGGWRHLN